MVLYATGEEQTSPLGVDGKPGTVPPPLPLIRQTVKIGGQPAEVQYAWRMRTGCRIVTGEREGNGQYLARKRGASVASVVCAASRSGVTIAVAGSKMAADFQPGLGGATGDALGVRGGEAVMFGRLGAWEIGPDALRSGGGTLFHSFPQSNQAGPPSFANLSSRYRRRRRRMTTTTAAADAAAAMRMATAICVSMDGSNVLTRSFRFRLPAPL